MLPKRLPTLIAGGLEGNKTGKYGSFL